MGVFIVHVSYIFNIFISSPLVLRSQNGMKIPSRNFNNNSARKIRALENHFIKMLHYGHGC